MILAAAAYANGETGATKPHELNILEKCRRWNVLPRGGGILDQPHGLLDRMVAVENVVSAIREYNANWNKGEWTTEHPETMVIMTRYWSLREEVENG